MQSAKSRHKPENLFPFFFGPTDFSIASCIFRRKFELDRPKIRFFGKFWSGIISNSSFQKNSFRSWVFLKSWFLKFITSKHHIEANFRSIGSKFSAKDAGWYQKWAKSSSHLYGMSEFWQRNHIESFTIHGKFSKACSTTNDKILRFSKKRLF